MRLCTEALRFSSHAPPSLGLSGHLPDYAKGESVAGEDIAVWYTGSLRHEDNMRDEDRDAVPVLWVGFELRPRNLFDATPFFGKNAR